MRKVAVLVGCLLVLLVGIQTTAPVGTIAAQDLSLVDTDLDGCNDAEEIEKGLDPNNPYDWPDGNSDLVIDTMDAQDTGFRWGAEYGDILYDPDYDRHDGTGANGPNGEIDIFDLQVVYGRFGMSCQGAPLPTIPNGVHLWVTGTDTDPAFESYVEKIVSPILSGGTASGGDVCVAGDGSFSVSLPPPVVPPVAPRSMNDDQEETEESNEPPC